MAHVWNVIDGDIYVSKNGDDTSGDGSMTNPYASINKATDVGADGNKIVIGTGIWQEARGTSTNRYNFIGDGEVIFDYSGGSYFIPFCDSSIGMDYTITNISFINSEGIIFGERSIYGDVFTYDQIIQYINCYIDTFGKVSNYMTRVYAIFKNCYINRLVSYNGGQANMTVYIYNCTINKLTFYKGDIHKLINTVVLDCYYNCSYQGIEHTTPTYNLIVKEEYPQYPVFDYEQNFFNLDPKFNDPEIGDYTLQPTSPCLFAGKNNANIGAYGLGYSFNSNSSEFTKEGGAIFSQTTEVDDIIRTQQTINGITHFLFQLNSGHTSGNVESAWIDLQTIRYLLITHIFDNLIYNSLGVATSRADNLETAGEKAVYYDFELKYCNEESEKDTATFKNVIWNKPVTVDNSGNGNANSNFVASEAQYISARFIKIKFYMKEG